VNRRIYITLCYNPFVSKALRYGLCVTMGLHVLRATHTRTIPASTLLTSASLSPVSPLDNIFALPVEVFSSCLAIVSAVMVSGLFLWPALRYGTGYQTVWEIRPSAETPSGVHWRHFYFHLTHVHSALELSGRCTLPIYLLTYLLTLLPIRKASLPFGWYSLGDFMFH